MVFSSSEFLLLFFPVVLILYNISKNIKYKNAILLISSLVFYAWGEPYFIFLMLFAIVINWVLGLLINKNEDKKRRKTFLAIGVIFDVSMMFVFKYLSFVCDNIDSLFGTTIDLSITLPIGISFFTFQIMSYLFDVYYKKADVQKNIFNLALYITMFPQLIAGPIVRYQTVADEINDRKCTSEDFTKGMIRFVYGLSKKIIVSNYVAVIADNIFALNPDEMSVASAWIGAIAYTLQIYFDFSGYSDMAIGMGLMFGFHFNENFNYPYIASSVSDFWRRWHISLSEWFRDYVYIPMGGNRVAKKKWILNLFTVWLLTGIWHGANWTFVVWGLLYFCILLIEKLTGFTKKLKWFSHVYTILVVILLWVIFRADNLGYAFSYILNMFGFGYCFADNLFLFYLDGSKWVMIIGILFSMPIIPFVKKKIIKLACRKCNSSETAEKKELTLQKVFNAGSAVTVLFLFVICVILCVNSTYNPFIYFNF